MGDTIAGPTIRGPNWVAWVRGPNVERADGEGEHPEQALTNLANALEKLGRDPNG